MKSSREQFEERFPTPTGVHWDQNNQCYVCKFVSPYLALWMGWQASREAIEIELPETEWLGDSWNGGWAIVRENLIEALEAQGFKVAGHV